MGNQNEAPPAAEHVPAAVPAPAGHQNWFTAALHWLLHWCRAHAAALRLRQRCAYVFAALAAVVPWRLTHGTHCCGALPTALHSVCCCASTALVLR